MKCIARDLAASMVKVPKVLRYHSGIGEEVRQRVPQRTKELHCLQISVREIETETGRSRPRLPSPGGCRCPDTEHLESGPPRRGNLLSYSPR